jgi:ribosomal protein L11 methyltransferase
VLRIRDSIVVTDVESDAEWKKLENEYPDRIVLNFPPQLAFGTGGHPTTASCLRFLADIAAERRDEDWSLVDLGSGSGILAIAAARLGASHVVAVEIDDMAMRWALQNADRHGVRDRIEFVERDATALLEENGRDPFDVITANLFSTLLVELFPSFPSILADQGDIVVSGFLTTQTREIVDAAAGAGLSIRHYLRRGKWVAARGGR